MNEELSFKRQEKIPSLFADVSPSRAILGGGRGRLEINERERELCAAALRNWPTSHSQQPVTRSLPTIGTCAMERPRAEVCWRCVAARWAAIPIEAVNVQAG